MAGKYYSPVWKDGIFTGKVLFCTGGAGTICSVQVGAFVALGGNACITGRNAEKTARVADGLASLRPGAKVLGLVADVRDAKALSDAAERCAKELGGIDFAIAGAAGNFLAPIAQLSTNAFKTVIEIDTVGSYNMVKACIPYLVKSAEKYNRTTGRIVFVSATLHYQGTPAQAHVMAAKAAVDSLAHSIAIEYGPFGITSNIVAPGPIGGTEGMERLTHEDHQEQSIVPLGRWGEPKEIADATVYLFSEAGNFVNGTSLVVDGGHWRSPAGSMIRPWTYPDIFLSGMKLEGVKTGRKPKL
ncbi:putative peroxisomal 2,4-dienoyl-CoA reductase SPS19 [Piedraia hortae CBS 480.64]|uniref:2,4-dienoyl-CoA reductase [(3E)-enoyl-CoA-producing] n=1 Tax=Piedraia hortae CBS 480.64 TaxID=1314780 RepID=A0A6A7C4N1_9PEZI|nr:putative peroxisomal 2,4-dienoyl-CoA reductase SPS19 [Piedraia hortae CBS 480.64]